MKCMILAILACVAAASAQYIGSGGLPYMPPVNSGYNRGGGHVNQGYDNANSGGRGGGYGGQGSSNYHDEGNHFNRVKQVTERENAGSHNTGGGQQGSQGGQGYNYYDNYGRGGLDAGNGYDSGYGNGYGYGLGMY